MHYKYKKVCIKKPGRAGGQRPAAWPGGNSKKYAPKTDKKPAAGRISLLPEGTDGLRGLQNQKKGVKKRRKRGLAGQKPRLSRSTRYRRPESGGGVCGSGGCLVCTLFAGSITEAAGAA